MKPERATLTRSPYENGNGQWQAPAEVRGGPVLISFPKDPGPLEKGQTVTVHLTQFMQWVANG